MLSRSLCFFFALLLCAYGVFAEAPAVPAQQNIEVFETEKKVDQLLLLIQKRLSIMHEVARTKWNQNLPVEDLVREKQILTGLVDQSKGRGLDENWLAQFFQAQMDASKEIQKNDIALWKKQGVQKFASVFTLAQLRSYIDGINEEMIQLLSEISDPSHTGLILDRPISNRASDAIETKVWKIAISPFQD